MAVIDKSVLRRVHRRDRWARWVITVGGIVIIGSVVAIIAVILFEAAPLFAPAQSRVLVDGQELPDLAEPALAAGVDLVELGQNLSSASITAYGFVPSGEVLFWDVAVPADRRERPSVKLVHRARLREFGPVDAGVSEAAAGVKEPPMKGGASGGAAASGSRLLLRDVARTSASRYLCRWSDGAATLVQVEITPQFDDSGRRNVTYGVKRLAELPAEKDKTPVREAMCAVEGGGFRCARLWPDRRLELLVVSVRENMLTGETEEQRESSWLADPPGDRPVTAMAFNQDGSRLFVGTEDGRLGRWDFTPEGKVRRHENMIAFGDGRAVTALSSVYGNVSLAVGDGEGRLSIWFDVREGEQTHLRRIRDLYTHSGKVEAIIPSQRDKTLLSCGGGAVSLDYMTNGRHLLTLAPDRPLVQAGYSPRGNSVIGIDDANRLHLWKVSCPHADVTLASLFTKVHYEGYDRPEHKWQSSGDEPKHGLVPIIFGSLKATVYAMLFATPLALASAVYVSYFTTPGFRRAIKPIVEIMAALPSVVIGFLILLWFAPFLARWLTSFFTSLITVPLAFVLFLSFWQTVRRFDWAKRIEGGYEFLVLAPVLCAGVAAAMVLGPRIEDMIFGGDMRQWLFTAGWTQWKPQGLWTALFGSQGVQYEQLNALVVAMGLGFAVIPIIFSLADDALSNIPHSMTAASLALGASRWQTLWRVIVPSASPGIFAAIMVGFGRAVGETMIVFMAAGNTPIIDMSPFNGFRTLAANIAVEMPEAPFGGTLFRLLFLCAVILFCTTFALNTLAEVVRQRLRKRFGRY